MGDLRRRGSALAKAAAESGYTMALGTRNIGVLLLIESCWAKTADWRFADGSYSSTRFPDKCISKLNIISIPPDAQQLYT